MTDINQDYLLEQFGLAEEYLRRADHLSDFERFLSHTARWLSNEPS